MSEWATHRLLRTLVLWTLVVLAAVAGHAQNLLIGASVSGGMGEYPLASEVEVRAYSGAWRASGLWSPSRKLESGAGYRLAVDVDRLLGPMIAGAGIHYRDGGPWSKTGVWLMAGYGGHQTRVMVRHELPTASNLNDVWSLGIVATLDRFEFRSEVYNYRQAGARRFGATQGVLIRVGK